MNKMILPQKLQGTAGLSQEKEEAIEGFKKDPAVYEAIQRLGLSKGQVKEFVGPLLDLQEDLAYCSSCPGLAQCKKANPHFNVRLELEDGILDRHYDPCPLAEKEARFERNYLKREFPAEWKDYDLSRVDLSAKRSEAIVEMTKILKRKSDRWLYLTGGKKSGKSMMLASFSNMYAERVASPVAFLSASSFLEELKNLSFEDKKKGAERFSSYASCPLLILDGLGNEFVSEYSFSTFLFPLLLQRSSSGLLTCFSSSLTLKEVCSLYGQKVGPIRAKQFYDLLKDYCGKEIDIGSSSLY